MIEFSTHNEMEGHASFVSIVAVRVGAPVPSPNTADTLRRAAELHRQGDFLCEQGSKGSFPGSSQGRDRERWSACYSPAPLGIIGMRTGQQTSRRASL